MIFARHRLVLALCGALLFVLACSPKTEAPQSGNSPTPTAGAPGAAASAPASGASAPLPTVTVSTIKAQKRELPVTLQATGTVSPITSVDLRAQATSTISKIHFNDGQFVKAGQLLFTLDSRTDEANLAKAKAQMAKDNASLADARRQYERAKQLFGQNFISQGAVDTALAQVESLTATVAADQAAIDATKVSLSYDRIVAPVAGRAGVISVSVGSVVISNTTPLVTITQLDPIAVAFSIPQRNLSDALAALKGGGSEVTATLADGGGKFTGHLQFVDNQVDASAGTVKAKAVFTNKEGKLWPGAFVNVTQTVAILKDAVVLPQAAIVQGVRGTIVYVVQDGKATLKPVKVVYAEGGEAAVTGIKPGEMVVLDGKQNVRPNSPVAERAKEPKSGASAPAGSASAPAGTASAAVANQAGKP
jgi:RND family efflux transporter MFP subunit